MWHDKTDKPKTDDDYFFYDHQTGKEFITNGFTEADYTYWRKLTKTDLIIHRIKMLFKMKKL